MKSFFLGMMLFAYSQAATASNLTLFNCQSEDGTLEIAYSTTSSVGTQELHVIKDGEVLFPPPSDHQFSELSEIEVTTTVFGTLVTGIDSSMTPVDAPSYLNGFFIPNFRTDTDQNGIEFDSYYLRGHAGGHIPSWVAPQMVSDTLPLTCTGVAAVF